MALDEETVEPVNVSFINVAAGSSVDEAMSKLKQRTPVGRRKRERVVSGVGVFILSIMINGLG